MAASLDEIQGYDLLQAEMEELLELYLKVVDDSLKGKVWYQINAFIEFTCFNLHLENFEQIDQIVVGEFKNWLIFYSPFAEYSEKLLFDYLYFRNKGL